MTIPDAIEKAAEGGYHVYGRDGVETSFSGANNRYSAWIRKDNHAPFIVRVEDTFLDTLFWRALGQTLGWKETKRPKDAPHVVGSDEWLYYWHRFINHIVAGKTQASFFASLPSPIRV